MFIDAYSSPDYGVLTRLILEVADFQFNCFIASLSKNEQRELYLLEFPYWLLSPRGRWRKGFWFLVHYIAASPYE